MNIETVRCLYCQTKHEIINDEFDKCDVNKSDSKIVNCANCGMPLSQLNPEGTRARYKRFLPFFWCIVIFCLIMVFYLPR